MNEVLEQMNYVESDGSVGDSNTFPWTVTTACCTCAVKSAREQVQDQILLKMVEAIDANDLKKAKELAKLAKALKEL